MFSRILIPLDGSQLAEAILTQVRQILTRDNAEVVLMQAMEFPGPAYGFHHARPPELKEETKQYVHTVAERLRADGVRVQEFVFVEMAAEAILKCSATCKASLIAMSTHGRTGLARWVFGSVAEKVLRESTVPMLLMRSFHRSKAGVPEPAPTDHAPFHKILVPVDTGELTMSVLPYVSDFAKVFDSEVTLLHVVQGTGDASTKEQGTRNMEGAAGKLSSAGVSVVKEVRPPKEEHRQDPAAKIVDFAAENDFDMIAMTTHGRAGIQRWTFGSTTEKVLRHATVPMLVIRSAETPGH